MLKRRVVRDPKRETITVVVVILVVLAVFFIVMNYLVDQAAVSATEVRSGPLQFSLRMPKTNYREGEPVPLELSVHNTGTESVVLRFEKEREFDFVVQQDLNLIFLSVPLTVWTYSGSHPSARATHRKALEPGKSLVYRAEWPQVNSKGEAVGSGRYVILGTVNLQGKDKQTLQLRGRTDR